MKVVIFSDTHLGKEFDEKKFDLLQGVISNANQVIINGDFWDGYFLTFDEFMKSHWKKLFPVLKSKKAIYLYGNHDQERWMDGRVKEFSDKQDYQYKFKSGGRVILVTHGNSLEKLDKCATWRRPGWQNLGKTIHAVEEWAFIVGGGVWLKARCGTKAWKLKKKMTDPKVADVVICGHTHLAESDLQKGYVNDGFIGLGWASWVEVEGGEVKLVKSRYEA